MTCFSGILLRKIEELNDEVTRVRKENVELLKKQGVCTVCFVIVLIILSYVIVKP